jgi:adenylate cyclase
MDWFEMSMGLLGGLAFFLYGLEMMSGPLKAIAGAVADFALAVMETIPSLCEAEGCPLDLRIGIHSGPVVAGVIGEKRFAYDLWGDTVNTESRMESSGEAGRIQISPDTRAMLGDEWEVESRGEIEIRGKGRMQTYFLTGKRECPGETLVETA